MLRTILEPREFLASQKLEKLPLHPQEVQRLKALGYITVADAWSATPTLLKAHFGKRATAIHHLVNGGGDQGITPNYPKAAVIAQRRTPQGCDNIEDLKIIFSLIAHELATTLSTQDSESKNLTIWLDCEDDQTLTVVRCLPRPVRTPHSIALALERVVRLPKSPILSTRVMLSQTTSCSTAQATFQAMLSLEEKQKRVTQAQRLVNEVFGENAIILAPQIPTERRVKLLRAWGDALGWR